VSRDDLFTREEVLAEHPARRAQTLLFLIQNYAAYSAARSRLDAELVPLEETAREQERVFLEAFAVGRSPLQRPSIQTLELQTPNWRSLVPERPSLRAALAHLLSQEYTFTRQSVPQLRAALGLDDVAVPEEYLRLYAQPLTTIYAPQVSLGARIKWMWAAFGGALQRLPPFWYAFLFTFALGVPQATLAYPIAAATAGPLPGVALTVLTAAISVITVASVAEAAARSGVVRYGTAYIGKLAAEYLGPAGSVLFTAGSFTSYWLAMLAALFAMSVTLGALTPVPAPLWTLILFGGSVALLARGTPTFSVALLITLGVTVAVLLLAIIGLSIPHAHVGNLTYVGTYVGTVSGKHPGSVQNLFGIILMGFFGEAFVVQCGKAVLPRDPSGRSLITGSLAGLLAIAVLLCLWTLVVSGVVAPDVLRRQMGTAIVPLAAAAGQSVSVLGALLVIVLLGLTFTRCMIAAMNLVLERLPRRSQPIVTLGRGRGHLVFRARGPSTSAPVLRLAYLGLADGRPRVRIDSLVDETVHCVEETLTSHWDTRAIQGHLPGLRDVTLAVDVIDAGQTALRLQITSPLVCTHEGNGEQRPAQAAPARGAQSPEGRLRTVLAGDRVRFLVSISPIIALYICTGALLLAGSGSFAGVLGIVGVLSLSIVSGFIPVLLLVSSRRRGEIIPGVLLGFLGNPLIVGGIFLLYLAILLVHGIVIWQSPVARAAALLTALGSLVATVMMVRGGAFRSRVVVEICEDLRRDGAASFSVVAGGQPLPVDVRLQYPQSEQALRTARGEVPDFAHLRAITFGLPATAAQEIKVWAHLVTPAGSSEAMPATLELANGSTHTSLDLQLCGGQVVLPLAAACRLSLQLPR
jgi:hypothetical protein